MKLSIITINYNNAKGLRKTLASVASQTYCDFEHIIVDGGSTDGSVEIIRQYADNEAIRRENSKTDNLASLPNHFITSSPIIWISEPDSGIYNAMNKGIHMAAGEYLLFLNSGDYLVDGSVVEHILQLDLHDDICYGYQMNEIDGELVEEICIDPAYITFDTMRNAHIPHQSSLIQKTTLLALGGYDESNKIVSDWAYVMKCIFRYNGTISRIPIHIAVYDTNGISSAPDKTWQWEERRKVLLRDFPRIMPDYERWDRLNQNLYMRVVKIVREFKNKLCR